MSHNMTRNSHPVPSGAPHAPAVRARFRLRAFAASGLAACLAASGFGLESFGPSAAQAGPLSIASRADVSLPKLTEDVHYTGRRHRHRHRGGDAAAAAALGAFGLIMGAAIASSRCRYVDPWGRCVRHRSYYYGPSYYEPAYVGGYYPAYRRRVVHYPRVYHHRYVVHRSGPRFVTHRAGPRYVHRGGAPHFGRHRR
jgi:hypothetical protein